MKKTTGLSYAVLGIGFTLFCVLALAIPTTKTATFWIVFTFTVVAFAVQVIVWKLAFGKEDTMKSKFLGFPIIHVGLVYLTIQLVAFAVFMAAATVLPPWSSIVACALIFGLSALSLIAAEAGRDEVQRVEDKVKAKVFYTKALQVDVELLAKEAPEGSIKNTLNDLAQKIRFSDPMSHEQLAPLEEKLALLVEEMKSAHENDMLELILAANKVLNERNAKCKLLK